jgi:predicted SnoaL-like aldol condensation-catalyzing enzyme
MRTDTPQTQAAISFLTLVTTGKVREAFDAHVHPDFRHHNVHTKNGREELMNGMQESDDHFPHKTFSVKRLLEDGDTVAAHSSIELGGGMPPMAVVHIFRFRDGKIAEMWDIAQQIPPDSPNADGAF